VSAETLRAAAALMRSRAEAATPGPWECYGDHLVWPSDKGPAANDPILAMVGEAHDDSTHHIASWHPAVALAVADWLNACALVTEVAPDQAQGQRATGRPRLPRHHPMTTDLPHAIFAIACAVAALGITAWGVWRELGETNEENA